jgi:hypothetical protein
MKIRPFFVEFRLKTFHQPTEVEPFPSSVQELLEPPIYSGQNMRFKSTRVCTGLF